MIPLNDRFAPHGARTPSHPSTTHRSSSLRPSLGHLTRAALIGGSLALVCFLCLAACDKKEEARDVMEIEKVGVGEYNTVALFNNYGSVFVLSGRSLPRSMWGKLIRRAKGSSQAAAKKNLEKLTATSTKTGDQVTIKVKAPNQKDYKAKLSATVPVESHIKVANKKGKVSVLGVRGSVDVDNDAGEVVVRGMKGKVRIKSKKGSITLSGGVEAVDVVNGSGNIRATFRHDKLTQDSVLRTEAGDITLRVPKKFSGKVSLRSGAGKIVANFPMDRKGSENATATLGEGGKLLVVESKKGKVRVLQLPLRHYKPFDARGLPRVMGGNPYKRRNKGSRGGSKKRKGGMKPNPYNPTWPRHHGHPGHTHPGHTRPGHRH